MSEATLFEEPVKSRALIVPRDYQTEAHDNALRLMDDGVPGVLLRMATGSGKTLTASLIIDSWLRRGDDYRAMVISYETQLVWQFAKEIEAFIGIQPGIEMEKNRADSSNKVVVASRQSLLQHPPPTQEQIDELKALGIAEVRCITKKMAESYIKYLRKGISVDEVLADIETKSQQPEAANGKWSRVHKFDWRLNWLLCFDEAHRHSHNLLSVGHIVDWFEQNPKTARAGLTATPKRSDGVSIGSKMFPGIAIDYPLFSREGRCALKDGYAVPYLQRYIEVEGVDFKQIKRITEGGDFDEAELARVLGEDKQLAGLVDPMLDMVGDRPTLIFSPTVEMAKKVARYINARCEAKCECGMTRWYPRQLVGDGATCECGRFITQENVTKDKEQAVELDGEVPHHIRDEYYRKFEEKHFQMLSLCGLGREGFDAPSIACVAVFRPVTKKASSLAEQMKGRGCRPLRDIAKILHTLPTAEDRRRMIAESNKKDCLVIDLVGITGLADCASTAEIYAEGLPDEVIKRAEEILADKGKDEEIDVQEVLEQAEKEDREAKERIRKEREAAERLAKEEFEKRAKADPRARYTTHERGVGSNYDPNEASPEQYNFIKALGMDIDDVLSRRKAGRIISMLKQRMSPADVAYKNGISAWEATPPSPKQKYACKTLGYESVSSSYEASQILSAARKPQEFRDRKLKDIQSAKNDGDLTAVGIDMRLVRKVCPPEIWAEIVAAGTAKRKQLAPIMAEDIPE
jgi:superfamily II DNA or RNA helicase